MRVVNLAASWKDWKDGGRNAALAWALIDKVTRHCMVFFMAEGEKDVQLFCGEQDGRSPSYSLRPDADFTGGAWQIEGDDGIWLMANRGDLGGGHVTIGAKGKHVIIQDPGTGTEQEWMRPLGSFTLKLSEDGKQMRLTL